MRCPSKYPNKPHYYDYVIVNTEFIERERHDGDRDYPVNGPTDEEEDEEIII